MPGDIVQARIIHKRGDVYFAEIVSYQERSKFQIPVNCEVFKDCGGCEWLHIKYEDQLNFKQQIVEEFFTSFISARDVILPIAPSPKINHYRNKIFLPVASSGDGLTAGMYARRSHRVIPHKRCYLQPEISDGIIELTLDLLTKANVTAYDEKRNQGTMRYIGLRYSEAFDKYLVILVANTRKLPFFNTIVKGLDEEYPEIIGVIQNINEGKTNRILGEETKSLYGTEYLEEKIGDISYRTHYRSFFQVNTEQTKQILDFITEHIAPDSIVIDAYSGIGTIGIYIAERVKEVICLEEYIKGVIDGLENAQMNNLTNCRFVNCRVEDEIDNLLNTSEADTIILDPPRKGIEKSIVDSINKSKLTKIIYISCDIATQKRDLELLMKGDFRVEVIKPHDMFPHTYHIENVVIMTRQI